MIKIVLAANFVTVQEAVAKAVSADPEVVLAGIAVTGKQAVEMTCELHPDIVVMGWRVHQDDGAAASAEIMTVCPTPVVVIAEPGISEEGPALTSGELAFIHFPNPGQPSSETRFLSDLKAMAQVKVVRHFRPKPLGRIRDSGHSGVVAITASTGGPAALKAVLEALPSDFPLPILVVQHISEGFVDGVVSWLDTESSMKVKIAVNDERMVAGTVYFAPDGHHLGVLSRSRLLLSDACPVRGFRPSGTFLLESVSKIFGQDVLAVVLTGMGDDGLEGARAVHEAGGTVIAQDEGSSVVFGMPRAVAEAGVANHILPITDISGKITLLTAGMGGTKKKPRH